METAYDTFAYTRRLTQAGVEDKHAEALTDALRVAFSEGVATKADIARLEGRSKDAWTRWRRTCAPCNGFSASWPPCSS